MRGILGLGLAALMTSVSLAAGSSTDGGRYQLSEGRITGFGEGGPQTVTIMLDTETGRSWFLSLLDRSPKWLPLTFSSPAPSDTLPPEIDRR